MAENPRFYEEDEDDEQIFGSEVYLPKKVADQLRKAEPERPSHSLRLLGATALGLTSMAAGLAVSRYRATHA